MMFLARFWPVFAGLLVISLLTWLGHVMLDRADQAGYDRATAEMTVTVAEANAKARSDEQAAQKRANERDREHQKAIIDLDARYAARPVPAVRLCPPAAREVRVPTATAATSRDPAAAGGDRLPGPAIADIGPDLERLVRIADRQAQQLITCMRFVSP